MELSEEIKEARDILQNIVKAKKTFRMYPQNNPIYMKTLEESYAKFRHYFDYKDSLSLKIKQNGIYYDSEQIYFNQEKEDNLALFFFKDGLRELTFKKGMLLEELEEFLKITAMDFDRDAVDDDIVILLWERDFQNIHYVVDESILVDIDDADYATSAEEKGHEKVTDVNDLMKAYSDGFMEDEVKTISIVPLADKDLQMLVKELEKDATDKVGKLVTILFEIIYQADMKSDIEDTVTFLNDAVRYSMTHGDIQTVLHVMKNAKQTMDDPSFLDDEKKYLKMIPLYLGSEEIVGLLAELLDSGIDIDVKIFEELIDFFDKNAIDPLVKYLGELKTIRARKYVIDALTVVGKKDIQALSRGLNDQRWYVVRNIIYILRKIGDKRAIEYLLKTIRHGDVRVRKEVIKALGELGGREVIQALRECLDDPDMHVRASAAKAFATIGSEASKKIILDKIAGKEFREKDFDEKREFFEVLSQWKDTDVYVFLVKILKTRSFFNRAKLLESKAGAAYCLGLIGNKDALPLLHKIKDSSNKLLKDFSYTAIRKLEYGQ
jgi:HEAT repeat protein